MLNIINKLKFFFKKLKLTENQYYDLKRKSERYENMMKCVIVKSTPNYVYAKDGYGNKVYSSLESMDYEVSLNVVEMLKAGGFEIQEPDKWKWNINIQ